MTIQVCNHYIYIPLLCFGMLLGIAGIIQEYYVFNEHNFNFNCDDYGGKSWDRFDCVQTEMAMAMKIALLVGCGLVLFLERNGRYQWFKRVDCKK